MDGGGRYRLFQFDDLLAQDACGPIGDPSAQVQQVPEPPGDFSSEQVDGCCVALVRCQRDHDDGCRVSEADTRDGYKPAT
jgi:hypothetical protein